METLSSRKEQLSDLIFIFLLSLHFFFPFDLLLVFDWGRLWNGARLRHWLSWMQLGALFKCRLWDQALVICIIWWRRWRRLWFWNWWFLWLLCRVWLVWILKLFILSVIAGNDYSGWRFAYVAFLYSVYWFVWNGKQIFDLKVLRCVGVIPIIFIYCPSQRVAKLGVGLIMVVVGYVQRL